MFSIIKMVNPELVRQLLKELEAEKGRPVQLRADTPKSEEYADGPVGYGREYFGGFVDRPIKVTCVEGLHKKHEDSKQFSGDYASLANLHERVNQFNQTWQKRNPSEFDPKYQVSVRGIFADPVPAGWGLHYETKVADISLKLIE